MNQPFDLGEALIVDSKNASEKGQTVDASTFPDAAEADAHLSSCINTNSYTNKYREGLEVKISSVTSNDLKRPQMTSDDLKRLSRGWREKDVIRFVEILFKGGGDPSFIKKCVSTLILGCDPPLPGVDTAVLIESALQHANKRGINFTQEVRDFVLTSSGLFLTSDVFNRLHVTSRQEKKNVVNALLRLLKEGKIERHPGRDGCYRRVDDQAEEINFRNAPTESLPIHWPFEIETLVRTLPRNIIVVAGSPNSGKTAFLLNVVRLNMEEHRIHYFSSEMGAQELRNRLSKFELPLDAWSFTAKERSSNFADVIRPDDVNIIDFLEVHENFYQVGAWIKEIFDKLRNGIAVVALQKNPGSDVGLGGQRSLEKARLYLSMEPGIIKIVKAKNWENPEKNPNGMEMRFKLVKGCRFHHDGYWKRP